MARRSSDNAIDWDAIERQFRLGQRSKKQLAVEYGVAASSIGRRAEKFGWIADKSQEVDAATKTLLIQNASGNANPNATPTAFEIKVAAQTNADIVVGHRHGLQKLRILRDKLLNEVEFVTDNLELFDQLGDLLDEAGPGANGTWKRDRVNEAYRKVITLTERIDNTRKLAEIDERVRKGEREAFGLDKGEDRSTHLDDMLKKVHAEMTAGKKS